jgi:tyrosine-protein kinase
MPALVSPRERATRLTRYYVALLRRWFWLLGLCLLLGGAGAYIGSKLIAPTYRATTLLVVGQQTSGTDLYNGVLAGTQLIPTYMSLMDQPVVLQRAATEVGGVTEQQLANRIHIVDQAGTQIIELDVDDPNPDRAARLANAIANTFVTLQQQSATATLTQEQQQADQELAQESDTIASLNAQITSIHAQNPNDSRLQGLQQQLAVAQARQSALQSASDQLVAQAITATNTVRVFQAAIPPITPDHPKPLQNAGIGAALGLVIAAVLVWLLEFFNSSIRTPDEAEALLDLPVVGFVGSYPRRALLLGGSRRTSNRSLSRDFRALVAKVGLAHAVEPARCIAITSATTGEGRTTVAINLAISLARKGERVLLVDGDLHQADRNDVRTETWWPLRRSGAWHVDIQAPLNRQGDLPNPISLSLVLTKQEYQTMAMPSVASIPGLSILPAGQWLTIDTAKLFRSDRFHHFLQRLVDGPSGGEFDVVVFDTPPADAYPDAALIARWATATLLVVDTRHSKEEAVLRAKDQLQRAHASITGIVLNRATAHEQSAPVSETQSAPGAEKAQDLSDYHNGRVAADESVGALARGESERWRAKDPSTS